MKALRLLIPLLLLATPALAQSGLISGVVVVAQNESGTATADVPVIVGGEEAGETGGDGRVSIPDGSFDDGDEVEVFVTRGDEPVIYLDPKGENSCEDENDKNDDEEDDKDCVSVGVLKWKKGVIEIGFGDDPTGGYESGGGRPTENDDWVDDEDADYGADFAIGYNGDWESITFTVRGFWKQPVEQVPVDLEVGFEYIKPNEFTSIFMPMIDLSCRYLLTEEVSLYGAGGLRFVRQKFSRIGFSNSNVETGFALRGGGQYNLGVVLLFAEIELMRAYSTSIFEGRGGVRYGFDF